MFDRLPHTDAPSLILVVDDEPKNIQVVGALLIKHGHEVIAADSGPQALAKLAAVKPDLILLDVMMPGMTGFELCRILQADPETRDIPIIFLSAAADKSFVIAALQNGGVDYIAKPFHGPELLARVDLHSSLQKVRRRLAEMIAEKNRLLEIVAHDLKNPLNGIQFAAMMLAEKSTGADPKQDILVGSIKDSASRAFEIIANLLATPTLDSVKTNIRKEPVCLKENALKALRIFEQHMRSKEIQLDLRLPEHSVIVLGEDNSLRCCLENLISNAIHHQPPGGEASVSVFSNDSHVVLEVADHGPGISADHLPRLFDRFYRIDPARGPASGHSGLGLAIVQAIVENHQGSVEVESVPGAGATFRVCLPALGS